MTNLYEQALLEVQTQVGRLEGALDAVKSQLASSVATEAELRRELEACRLEVGRLESELALAQREAAEKERTTADRIVALETEVEEARRGRRAAETERAAVIAALGRRSRRLFQRDAEQHPT